MRVFVVAVFAGNFVSNFTSGALAGCAAAVATMPFDVLKTTIQVHTGFRGRVRTTTSVFFLASAAAASACCVWCLPVLLRYHLLADINVVGLFGDAGRVLRCALCYARNCSNRGMGRIL